ncbi:MAG: OmpA family protein [Gammaproteobacteria bacterium]
MFEFVLRGFAVALAGVFLAAADIAGGGVSRAEAGFSGQPGAGLRELAERFQAETPYVVTFREDDTELDDEARRRLDIQAAWIIAHPNVRARVYGHSARLGNTAFNMAMALRRASLVADYLAEKGIDRSRLEAMVSFGEEFSRIGFRGEFAANRLTVTAIIGLRRDGPDASMPGGKPRFDSVLEPVFPVAGGNTLRRRSGQGGHGV